LGATYKSTSSRISFSKIASVVDMPDLLALQKDSFQEFLQENVLEDERLPIGLEGVFRNVFPLEDTHRNYVLEFSNYFLGLPKYTPDECIDRGVTYSLPLKVRLVLHITDEEDKNKFAQSIEQEVYFGNIPYMTDKGTFVINGAERVIVSQLQRSPGVFFDENIHPKWDEIISSENYSI